MDHTRCASYCRLSKEDAVKPAPESESIQNQKQLLTGYARTQGWEIYDLYTDEDYSGADADRVLKKMEDSTGVSPGAFDETNGAVVTVPAGGKD